MKILLIDDMLEQRNAISASLIARYGRRTVVRTAADGLQGKDAGDAALDPLWDAVLIDLSLPEAKGSGIRSNDGLTVAAVFRKDANYGHSVIVVYSRGFVDKSDPATNWKKYESSGIFACETSVGSDLADVVDAHLGLGPWQWRWQ